MGRILKVYLVNAIPDLQCVPICWLIVLTQLLVGCRGTGTQGFTPVPSSQVHSLTESSRVVLDVRCTNIVAHADYNFYENYMTMLAPVPKGYKIDITFHVERVIKGQFAEQFTRVRWLRYPTEEQLKVLGIPYRGPMAYKFTNGMPLRVGFDACSGQRLRNLRLTVRRE